MRAVRAFAQPVLVARRAAAAAEERRTRPGAERARRRDGPGGAPRAALLAVSPAAWRGISERQRPQPPAAQDARPVPSAAADDAAT